MNGRRYSKTFKLSSITQIVISVAPMGLWAQRIWFSGWEGRGGIVINQDQYSEPIASDDNWDESLNAVVPQQVYPLLKAIADIENGSA